MTKWSDIDELGLTDEVDEFDPSAPMITRDDPADEAPHDALLSGERLDDDVFVGQRPSLLDESGEFTLAFGFSDASGVVRVWVDDDNAITKVRVAPSWRERFGTGNDDPDEGLVSAFGVTFMAINNRTFGGLVPPAALEGDDVPDVGPLTWAALAQADHLTDELVAQREALAPDEGHGQWRGEQAEGWNRNRKVKVTLSIEGRYSSVWFDSAWLASCRVSQLGDAVIEAAAAARSAFVPPTYEPGERDRIAAQHMAIRDELRSMMKRGFL